MLQAESSCARDWEAHQLPATVASIKKVKRTTIKVNHIRKILVKGGIFIFGYALILVFLCISSATLGYRIEKLEKDVLSLETANNRIEYQIAQKTSLDRVEQVASKELGMYKSDDNRSIAMKVNNEPINIAQNLAITEIASDEQILSQKILRKIYSSLSHLAQK
ncbi:MAG: hypothetical protein PHF24_05700 [Syntrophomonas sp.]|nr:hypothetical protein [Syntrophomonas sp.]